jgi:hypothetical protein
MSPDERRERKYMRAIAKILSRQRRKEARNVWPQIVYADPLKRRAAIAARIAACNEGGLVAVVSESTDCDHVHVSNYCELIPATVYGWLRYEARMDRDAEGPWSAYIAKSSEIAHLRPVYHDRIAESFENGHPYLVRG